MRHEVLTLPSPGGFTVLYDPEPDPRLADRAGEWLDDSHHEALHLQEVSPPDTGRAVNQENNICCSHIVTPTCKYQ